MIEFKVGEEYAWIEEIGRARQPVTFVKIEKIDRNFYTKEQMVGFSNHPYWFDFELYDIGAVLYELKRKTTLIKIESEQHKLALRIKYGC